jgi:hypothetical protein
MAKPWADLTSAERLDAILLAVDALERAGRDATGNSIAYEVGKTHPMRYPRSGNHGRGNVARQMSHATRVTPGITALRNRGLLWLCSRMDGWSGSADVLTDAGEERVRQIRAAQTPPSHGRRHSDG